LASTAFGAVFTSVVFAVCAWPKQSAAEQSSAAQQVTDLYFMSLP
jgi:hypothetical protein